MRKVIAVRNNSRVGVIRANLLFPAGKVATIMMDVETSRFKEIKACSALQIVGMEDYVDLDFAADMAALKVTDESAVVPPEPVTKEEASEAGAALAHHKAEEREASEAAATLAEYEHEQAAKEEAPVEPVIDTTPVVVAAEDPPENVAELEVMEPVVEEEAEVPEVTAFDCPYCDAFSAPKKTGALNHVRSKHPDKYDEYKERLHNV